MYTSNFKVFFKFNLFVAPLIKMQCFLATVCLKTKTLDLHANISPKASSHFYH